MEDRCMSLKAKIRGKRNHMWLSLRLESDNCGAKVLLVKLNN